MMDTLYSYKRAYPYPLPEDLTFYDMSDFVQVEPKPEIAKDEKLDWSGDNWVIRKASSAETAIEGQRIRNERLLLLADSDVHIIRAYETQTQIPQNIVEYRQALRDITQQPGFPWEITWPTL